MKTLTATGILSFFFCIQILFAQTDPGLQRAPYKLSVFVDKKTVYEEDLIERPFISPANTIQLYPGEMIFVEIVEADGIIKSMKAVKVISDSSKTVIMSFSQVVEKNKHKSMMLKMYNPFKYKLLYDARISVLNKPGWSDTDVYPVEPGLSAFEIWPDIITSIGLGHFLLKK